MFIIIPHTLVIHHDFQVGFTEDDDLQYVSDTFEDASDEEDEEESMPREDVMPVGTAYDKHHASPGTVGHPYIVCSTLL
jgi:hypothetical protein